MAHTLKIEPTLATRKDAGFTLLEMLAVLAILGMLVSLVAPRVIGYLSESKVKTAKIQIEAFASAIDLYQLDTGRVPNSAETLEALVRKPASAKNWNGPYLRGGTVPKDPWGNAYLYRQPGQHGAYDLYSLGAEGREGQGNVSNWQR